MRIRDFTGDWPMMAGLFLVVVVIFCGVMAYRESREWQAWADTHCTVTGEIAGSSGLTSNGASVYIPGKTIYSCEGKTIIR